MQTFKEFLTEREVSSSKAIKDSKVYQVFGSAGASRSKKFFTAFNKSLNDIVSTKGVYAHTNFRPAAKGSDGIITYSWYIEEEDKDTYNNLIKQKSKVEQLVVKTLETLYDFKNDVDFKVSSKPSKRLNYTIGGVDNYTPALEVFITTIPSKDAEIKKTTEKTNSAPVNTYKGSNKDFKKILDGLNSGRKVYLNDGKNHEIIAIGTWSKLKKYYDLDDPDEVMSSNDYIVVFDGIVDKTLARYGITDYFAQDFWEQYTQDDLGGDYSVIVK